MEERMNGGTEEIMFIDIKDKLVNKLFPSLTLDLE